MIACDGLLEKVVSIPHGGDVRLRILRQDEQDRQQFPDAGAGGALRTRCQLGSAEKHGGIAPSFP
jgi:hypothetical protein